MLFKIPTLEENDTLEITYLAIRNTDDEVKKEITYILNNKKAEHLLFNNEYDSKFDIFDTKRFNGKLYSFDIYIRNRVLIIGIVIKLNMGKVEEKYIILDVYNNVYIADKDALFDDSDDFVCPKHREYFKMEGNKK